MNSVKIENLKSIKNVEFILPDEPGVYLLTGANGLGKTALLGVLHRIGFPYAFQKAFFTCKTNPKIDNFKKSKITYTVNGQSVSYMHREERWSPTPKRNSSVLNLFGFSSVKFFAVDERRIIPSKNEFESKTLRWKDANINVKEGAKAIFSSEKYDNLKYCQSRKGNAFSIPLGRDSRYTEKNFSSGEINVLRLLNGLHALANNALILIDEIEMSLHPKAQLELLAYLKKYAADKKSIILFSSHSETLIRSFSRSNIILMYLEGDNTKIQIGCFPEAALERISDRSIINLDYLILVEDLMAFTLTECLWNKYSLIVGAKIPRMKIHMGVKGRMGWSELIELSAKLQSSFPNTKIKPLLDKDAEDCVKHPEITNPTGNHALLKTYLSVLNNMVTFLPITPEQGLISWLLDAKQANYKFLKKSVYGDVDWSSLLLNAQSLKEVMENSKNGRDKSKNHLEKVISSIKKENLDRQEALIYQDLFEVYVNKSGLFTDNELKKLFGRLFG